MATKPSFRVQTNIISLIRIIGSFSSAALQDMDEKEAEGTSGASCPEEEEESSDEEGDSGLSFSHAPAPNSYSGKVRVEEVYF